MLAPENIPFIIHCTSRPDRLLSVKAELEREGIMQYEIVDAIEMSDGVAGCMASHKKVVAMAKERGLKYCIIFEDDINFMPGGWEWYRRLITVLPANWEFYFGGVYNGVPVETGTMNIRSIGNFSGTHCYAIRASMYETVLSAPATVNIDRHLAGLMPIAYVCYPFAAIQAPGYSEVVKAEVNYNQLLIKNKYRLLGLLPAQLEAKDEKKSKGKK